MADFSKMSLDLPNALTTALRQEYAHSMGYEYVPTRPGSTPSSHRAASAASIQETSGSSPSASLASPVTSAAATSVPAASFLRFFQAPTPEQLRALPFLLSGLAAASGSGGSAKRGKGRGKGRGHPRLAKDGQIISTAYDTFGRRPCPTNGISLEQSIVMELSIPGNGFITSSATPGASTYSARTFTINDFSAAATLLTVFDQYLISQVEVWIDFNTPNAITPFPQTVTAVDLDDANVPTSVGQVADHQGSLMSTGPSGHYHRWAPHVALATYSGVFTSFANAKAMWIDAASPNVQHYGLKAAMISNSSTAIAATLAVRAVIHFRAPAIN